MNSFLQTKDWLEFQKSLGRKTWEFDDEKIKANIIEHDLPFGKNYLYIPHGPVFQFENIDSVKTAVAKFVAYLKKTGKENKSIFIKMEPSSDLVIELLYHGGFKKSKKEIQPKKTVIINLLASEEEMFSLMHHKTRYNIRLAEKKGLKLEEGNDFETFWELLKNTAKNDRFFTHPKDYYEKLLNFFSDNRQIKTKMFFVKHPSAGSGQAKPIAGIILLFCGDTVYYLHGAMDRKYRNLMAPYLMHWEIIRLYKRLGYKFYDLWGIDSDKWPGVTRFKLGLGGNLLEYPGSFDLPVSKFWYLAYKILRSIF